MPNFLNLKKKDPSDIVYVEKIILKNRSLSVELFRMLTIIAVASGIVWGISNADEFINSTTTPEAKVQNFSVVGTIGEVATTTSSIILNNAKGSDDSGNTTYIVDTSNVNDVETNHFVAISLSDLKAGDNIIAQGVERGSVFQIYKIYSYGTAPATGILEADTTDDVATSTDATTTATTTPDIASTTATTTDDLASSTATTTDGTSTPSLLENIGNTVGGVIDAVKDATQNIVDKITGTSTDEVPSSTPVTPEVTPPAVVPQADASTPAPVVPPVVDTPTPVSEAPPVNSN